METKAGECCQKPVCEFQTQTGSFTGSGTISGHGTGISPTAPPACVDAIPDCNRYGNQACIDFKPWARDNCRKTCQLCGLYQFSIILYLGKIFQEFFNSTLYKTTKFWN